MVKRIEHKTENGIELKYCGKCQIYKDVTIFGNSKTSWDKLRPTCKECLKENNLNNKEKMTEYNKKYWEETKEEQKEKNKLWRENNKEYTKQKNKEWRVENKEHIKQKDKEYKKKNWDKIKKNHNEWLRKNYLDMKTNPERKDEFIRHKIKSNTGRRIREILGSAKSERCIDYVGCTLDQLRNHLELQFVDDMMWENYGSEWHIDHIIPCNAFALENEEQLKACFYYKNLQPLWAVDNIVKSDKYLKEDYDNYMTFFRTSIC
jgi:hypothetical protein